MQERFEQYTKKGQIRFCTFHQSFAYEDFIEGLKAITNERGAIEYEVQDGIFKTMAKQARENLEKSSEEKKYDP